MTWIYRMIAASTHFCSKSEVHDVDAATRDGNGAPIPDPRRGFTPLGDAIGVFLVPAGSLTGKFPSPSGEAGRRTFCKSPSPFPVGDPEYSPKPNVYNRQKEAHNTI
jgi:hypothetical protein